MKQILLLLWKSTESVRQAYYFVHIPPSLFFLSKGTDATHADHIETIKQRGYVGLLPDGGFVPGGLGMGLVDGKSEEGNALEGWLFFECSGYDSMGLQMSKPNLRAELEADLKR